MVPKSYYIYFIDMVLLHFTAPSNQDVFFGPFEDTQFDLVVDVETSHECLEGDPRYIFL